MGADVYYDRIGGYNYDSFRATTWSKGIAYNDPPNPVAAQPIVPPNAEYIPECQYGGTCTHCGWIVEAGNPIWWLRDNTALRSFIWCGGHKQNPEAKPVEGKSKTNKEQNMAQRQDFTFPYTGTEIATALEAKATKLDAQQQPALQLDRATAALFGYTTDADYEALLRSKQDEVDRANEKLTKKATALRKEAIPYAKAAKQEFFIDAEDIEHFGLDDDETPAPKKRIRRSPAAAAAVESEPEE
jgi:hypothetical protein